MDALGVPAGLYNDLKQGWIDDLRRPGANTVSVLDKSRWICWFATENPGLAQLRLETICV